MKHTFVSKILAVLMAVALFAAMLPQVVSADGTVPTFTFKAVKAGETVTVTGANFPKNVDFIVRMDKFGNLAVNGTEVGRINSGSGSFEATFNIPVALKNETTLAMRFDGTGGWYSYNWFTNKTSGSTSSPTATPAPGSGSTSTKPYIDVIGVVKNKSVTLQAGRFPANQTFSIRVGPFKDFFKKYVSAGTINSGSGGSFQFTVNLPESVKDVEMITIRLDGGSGVYAFNAFKNVSGGVTTPVVITPTPGSGTSTSNICQVTSTEPTKTLKTREDFDAAWTVKNVSGRTWEQHSVDYKLVSGTEMQKYGKTFDFTGTVKNGESITIRVDMLAPDKAGTYTTTWAIVESGKTLCNLPLTVVVK